MSVHFAAARSTAHSPIARALARKAHANAANDNGDAAECAAQAGSFDTMMRAALKHFAEHGMGAAQEARRQAEQAHFAGDSTGYDWWLGVCRALDRRLAETMDRRLNSDCALIY
ncbi:hypothetical protein K3172_11470 [Qipengyuania sp. 6B39]|uniref:hypothetical protein n=1 Tax=Qipengyuania proteolytica TaxID=2867239 RepID=UPI001C89A2A3|nr:hypothetical protein [Qipengyuania proteolytica]MBX7496474.1 hypothetical protein [Qipengyuania proteolytica]